MKGLLIGGLAVIGAVVVYQTAKKRGYLSGAPGSFKKPLSNAALAGLRAGWRAWGATNACAGFPGLG